MTRRNRILKALSVLLPAGALGASIALASAPAEASASATSGTTFPPASTQSVSARLQTIRTSVSEIAGMQPGQLDGDPKMTLAWWGNGGWGRWHMGWGNGGWGNGGWHNWNNGWHNWGNGGWHNWGNGWHNFWHNW
jgi:rSAM-associated Gly-rich repeat protein